jgi:hypothetical protein
MSDLTTDQFTQLKQYNDSFILKQKDYQNMLQQYEAYIGKPSNAKSAIDYNYWSDYTYLSDQIGQTGQTGQTGTNVQQTDCLNTCVTASSSSYGCFGASFIKNQGDNATNPSGKCYLETSNAELIESPGNVAVISQLQYYILSLKKINDDLLSINAKRMNYYTTISSSIDATNKYSSESISSMIASNNELNVNNAKLNNALANLDTTNSKYEDNTAFVEQENLKFQMLLIALYIIVFASFKLFNINNTMTYIILIGTGAITVMIVCLQLFKYI